MRLFFSALFWLAVVVVLSDPPGWLLALEIVLPFLAGVLVAFLAEGR